MHIAIDEKDTRIKAHKANKLEKYKCPICQNEVILKSGEIKIPHFAHKSGKCTDS